MRTGNLPAWRHATRALDANTRVRKVRWLAHQSFLRHKKMNRIELIEKLVSKNDLTKAAAGRILDTLIETIQAAVKKGDSVTLVGFGTFKSVKRAARIGKNPSTGASLKILATTVPKFTPGAKFKAIVDPKAAARKAAKAAAK